MSRDNTVAGLTIALQRAQSRIRELEKRVKDMERTRVRGVGLGWKNGKLVAEGDTEVYGSSDDGSVS